MKHPNRLTPGLAIFMLLLVGCSSNNTQNLEVPVKSFEDATLPSDPYVITEEDSILEMHARDLYISSCLAPQGMDYSVGDKPVHLVELSPEEKAARYQIYTVEHVANWGYRHPESVEQAAERTEVLTRFSEVEQEAFDACYEAWDAEGLLGESTYDLQAGNHLSAGTNVALHPELVAMWEPWRACLEMAGVAVPVGMAPFDYPHHVTAQKLSIDSEIQIAIADVKCRDEIGYSTAYYDALWDAELQILQDNANKLRDLPQRISESRARTHAYVDNYPNQ